MKEHKTILLFICGVLFASVLPLVDEFVTVIAAWMEWLKIIPSRHIAKGNKEMQDLYGSEEVGSTAAIGFQIPEPDEEYYEDEDEE